MSGGATSRGLSADRPTIGRAVAAVLGALLVYLVASSGLVYPAYLVDLQVGVVAGLVAGLIASSAGIAAGAAALGVFAGIALGASTSPPDVTGIGILLASSAGIAAAARVLVARYPRVRVALVTLGVLVVAANMWATAATLAPAPLGIRDGVPLAQELAVRPAASRTAPDSEFYRAVVWSLRDGKPFYSAYLDGWNRVWAGTAPGSIFDIKQPTIYVFWSLLPGWPMSALWAFLALATLAMACTPVVSSRAVPAALGIVSAAAIGAYLLAFPVTKQMLFLSEAWVGTLAVPCAAALVAAQVRPHHRRWVVASAAIAFVAMISRELMLYLMFAGIIAAFFAPKEHRRFDVAVWVAALVAALAYWGVHASRGRGLIAHVPRLAGAWMGKGGLDYVAKGVVDFTAFMTPYAWVAWLLLGLGVLGAALQPDRQFRAFALAAVLLPLLGFLFVGNVMISLRTGERINYWAAIVMPLVYALAPSALLLLPGLRRPATAQATEEKDEGAATEQMVAGA